MEGEVSLACGDCRLQVAPSMGGSIRRFDWRGIPVLRPSSGDSILNAACFPLVPFSNRIAHGRFDWNGRQVVLKPNFPGSDHPHPLHGFGWLSPWRVRDSHRSAVVLEHFYPGDEWPWAYRAELVYSLDERGLSASLSLTNLADTSMPAGLGFHPYFPRDVDTAYRGLHCGEWRNDRDCLPVALEEHGQPRDWWDGAPVGVRSIDTVFARRSGSLEIVSPASGLRVLIDPSPLLAFTAVLVPPDVDWFCVEPVSQATNAVNLGRPDSGVATLGPGQTLVGIMKIGANSLSVAR